MIYKFKKIIKKIAPSFLLDTYHFLWAFFSASVYGFPSRRIKVVAITGTKGKTTVAEIINAILNEAGLKTALVSSLRFKIGDKSWKNTLKMTMPGRGKIQRLLSEAVRDKCDWFILEATSEGIGQFRHKFIDFDAIIFTNLAPEHIESHGSFERYKEAKGRLFETKSRKKKTHIVNIDDKNVDYFLNFDANEKIGYGIDKQNDLPRENTLSPTPARSERSRSASLLSSSMTNLARSACATVFLAASRSVSKSGIYFRINDKDFSSLLLGEFNLYNILAAVSFARSQNIDWQIIKKAIEEFKGIKGRMQFIYEGQPFDVVIDYAHTPDSLAAVYSAIVNMRKFIPLEKNSLSGFTADNTNNIRDICGQIRGHSRLVCVLGAAGGGRDKWKRKEMGKIAAEYCDEIILTNEDSYDEKPEEILEQISSGFSQIPNSKFQIPNSYYKILNRKEAIKKALALAKAGDTVVLTGKGSESWIMTKGGKKIPWSEEAITRECLRNVK